MQDFQDQIDYISNLPPSSIDILKQYTGGLYIQVNGYLRGEASPSKVAKRAIKEIDQIFSDVPPLAKGITLYRGMTRKLIGKESYTSTTFSLEKATAFTKTICCFFEIYVPPGSKVLPLGSISLFPQEMEVLLDRKGKFIVTTQIKCKEGVTTKTCFQTVYIPTKSARLSLMRTVTELKKKLKPDSIFIDSNEP